MLWRWKLTNKHNITSANYQDEFVLVLAKSGAAILADWMAVPVEEIIGNPLYVVATRRIHIWHMSTGVTGESLELLEYKLLGESASGVPQEELTDALFYAVGMAKYIGIAQWQFWADHDCVDEADDDSVEYYVLQAAQLDDLLKKYNVYFDQEKLIEVQAQWKYFMRTLIHRIYKEFGSLQEAIDFNVDKLSKRYEGIQYSNKAAQERADKQFPIEGT
jgi:hypothetical protein